MLNVWIVMIQDQGQW